MPMPVVKKSRWPVRAVWLIPLGALAMAGYYARAHLAEQGPEVTLRFADAGGLRPDDSPVRSHGVEVGKVSEVRLSADGKTALVKLRLRASERAFARAGSRFWIVRPDFSNGNLVGITTVLSGPYVEALAPEDPNAPPADTFDGLDRTPVTFRSGVNVVLLASRLERVQVESPVYYRGVEVGVVTDVKLSLDATRVVVYAVVFDRYAPLVRANSRFWTIKAADVKGGVFSGVEVKLGSLRSLVSGGIEFATPDNLKENLGPPAVDGTRFALYEDAEKEWQEWNPVIPIQPSASTQPSEKQDPKVKRSENAIRAAAGEK